MTFIHTHACKAVVGVAGAVFLLAWPPALPWIAAVALLQWGVRHLVLAFREAERDEQNQAGIMAGAPALDAPDNQRGVIVPRNRDFSVRPQVVRTDSRSARPGSGRVPDRRAGQEDS
jgi:hypothetical protein